MKTLKVIGATIVLALSLSMPAFADNNPGDAHTPGRATSPTDDPTPVKTGSTGTATDIDNNDPSFLNIVDILWALASIY
ncbi:MAG TPA: hypothetical protein VGO56_02930 [Pyrinomonadaceae bacterium]|jgi:hypothetical protein|nr:hypothetical protein [Pyrinomonadaceae bacterium]